MSETILASKMPTNVRPIDCGLSVAEKCFTQREAANATRFETFTTRNTSRVNRQVSVFKVRGAYPSRKPYPSCDFVPCHSQIVPQASVLSKEVWRSAQGRQFLCRLKAAVSLPVSL